jgi:lipopolysaccharide export system protein LptA
MAIQAKITQSRPIQARTLAIGQAQRLTDLADIDSTRLANGATIIYDGATQTFKLTNEVDNPDTKIIGGKY